MSDNTTLPGAGDAIRDLDRAGVKTQIVALDLNPAGSESLMAGVLPVTTQPGTSGGYSVKTDDDLDNGSLTVVKASPGQLYGFDITNLTTATLYIKFYDATSGTCGTGTPIAKYAIPGNANDATAYARSFPDGIPFATGICVGACTGLADNDNTDPGANKVVSNFYYK